MYVCTIVCITSLFLYQKNSRKRQAEAIVVVVNREGFKSLSVRKEMISLLKIEQ